jgi:hypothetical protein
MSDVPREEPEPPPRLPEGYSLNRTDEDGPMALAREDDGRVVAVFPALTSAEEIEALAWELVGGTPPPWITASEKDAGRTCRAATRWTKPTPTR